MPGFRHPPLDDIARIRQDLRDRYQDGVAILKELLQNADDASAEPWANLRTADGPEDEISRPGNCPPLS